MKLKELVLQTPGTDVPQSILGSGKSLETAPQYRMLQNWTCVHLAERHPAPRETAGHWLTQKLPGHGLAQGGAWKAHWGDLPVESKKQVPLRLAPAGLWHVPRPSCPCLLQMVKEPHWDTRPQHTCHTYATSLDPAVTSTRPWADCIPHLCKIRPLTMP